MDKRILYSETDNRKKYLLYIGGSVLAIVLVVVLLGRIEFHNELEREILPHTLVGYIGDEQYYGIVTIQAEDWPQWAHSFDYPAETSVIFSNDGVGGRIGIFADLVYYENRYERRTWFSGRVLERASEYYYKPTGALYLEAVYEGNHDLEISIIQLVPQQYDFMAFDGTEDRNMQER